MKKATSNCACNSFGLLGVKDSNEEEILAIRVFRKSSAGKLAVVGSAANALLWSNNPKKVS